MMKQIEDPALLAAECLKDGLLSAIVSAPRPAPRPAPRRATTAANGTESPFEKIRIRPVLLKTGSCFQLEQFRGQKVFHRNVDAIELTALIAEWLSGVYSRAEFTTASLSIQVMANRRGELTALRKPAARPPENGVVPSSEIPAPVPSAHNRTKHHILQEGIPVPFLTDLGVMTADGTVIKAKYDKFRQINRFLEFIADVLPDLRRALGEETTRVLTIVDFGCGKSYLTFAVYYYLSVLQKMPVRIIGLDLKEDVIAHCATLASNYKYTGLTFAVGDIADYAGTDAADMVISLHACDTATDYALAQAVRWNARVILSVPCCQHELNAQLASPGGDTGRAILAPAFRHGIIRERMAALFTDALRAELLEQSGYQVQILEFIDMSHTPKNLLIRAVLKDRAVAKDRAGTEKDGSSEYRTIRDFLGVHPTLEKLLENKRVEQKEKA